MTLLKEIVSSKKLTEATNENTDKFWAAFDENAIKTAESELSKLLTKLIKVNVDLQITKGARGSHNQIGITVDSNNLAASMTPKMFKSLKITDFGNNVTDDGYLWVSLHYEYKHMDGGSNGTNIATIFLNNDGTIYKTNTEF